MSSSPETLRQIQDLVKSENVVLFMKGSRSFPQCGFSAAVVQILNSLLPEYKTVNVLADPGIRQGIKDYSSWPTVPQLYIAGEFVGGSDIVRELYSTGELQKKLGVEAAAVEPPEIRITEPAAQALRDALAEAGPDEHVHLAVSVGFEHELELGPRRPGEIEVVASGIILLIDPSSAGRAKGLTIDFVTGAHGSGFRMDNPNAGPGDVRGLAPRDLKAKLESGELPALYDVRPPAERASAHIEGSVLLDQDALAHIESLDRATPLAFYCHHGVRSRAAAQRFVELGFREVYNLAGGIDAWSREVDPKVPRYQ
jgi:monothiol glutaredoxin